MMPPSETIASVIQCRAPVTVAGGGDAGLVRQVRVLVAEAHEAAVSVARDARLLLPLRPLCFLDVCEVGVEGPADVERHLTLRPVGDLERDVQLGDAELVTDPDVECAVWDAPVVRDHLVPRLPTAAAAERVHLGVHVVEVEHRRLDHRGFGAPRQLAVDRQAEGAEVPRLPEVEARERLVLGAVTAVADNQQRLSMPAIEDLGTDVNL